MSEKKKCEKRGRHKWLFLGRVGDIVSEQCCVCGCHRIEDIYGNVSIKD